MGCQIFLCQTNDTGCRCHLLEASVVSAVADRFFFRINTCMTNLAACAVSTCYDLAVHDDSAADTGSKGNHNQVLASLSAACPHLTESCCVCVVCCFYCHSAEFVGKLFYDIFISPVQVDCDGKLTFVINRARYVDADTGNIICCDTLLTHFCFYAFCDIRQNFASAVFGAGRDFPFVQQSSVCLEQSAFY